MPAGQRGVARRGAKRAGLSVSAADLAKQAVIRAQRLRLPGFLVVLPIDVKVVRALRHDARAIRGRAHAGGGKLRVGLLLHLVLRAVVKLILRIKTCLQNRLPVRQCRRCGAGKILR